MRSFIIFVAIAAIAASTFGGTIKDGMVPMRQGRIIGGDYAHIESVSWTCSQQRLGSHRCGCAIISPTVTLTAAHCANHIPGDGFAVRAGSAFKNSGGQLIPTNNVFIHPSFNETILEHDICVMILASSLNTFVPEVSAIEMVAGGSTTIGGTISVVSGWGPMYENGFESEILRSATQPLIALNDCQLMLGGNLTHDMMCAGVYAGGIAACDPGSPLVANGVLMGVMSWSRGCGRPGLPTVYSRVSTARFWIDFIMNSNS